MLLTEYKKIIDEAVENAGDFEIEIVFVSGINWYKIREINQSFIVTDLIVELVEGEKSDMKIPCRYNLETCEDAGGPYCDPLCSGYEKLDDNILNPILF